MDWTVAVAFQHEHLRTPINRQMNSGVGKVGQDRKSSDRPNFLLKNHYSKTSCGHGKNGLIHMQLPTDIGVYYSKTTSCHIKIIKHQNCFRSNVKRTISPSGPQTHSKQKTANFHNSKCGLLK